MINSDLISPSLVSLLAATVETNLSLLLALINYRIQTTAIAIHYFTVAYMNIWIYEYMNKELYNQPLIVDDGKFLNIRCAAYRYIQEHTGTYPC